MFVSKLYKFLWQNGIAVAIAVFCVVLTLKTGLVVPILVPSVLIIHWVSFVLMVTGSVLVVYFLSQAIFRQSKFSGMEMGRGFIYSLLLILFGYAVDWHLSELYFFYEHLLVTLIPVILASIQVAIWDRVIPNRNIPSMADKAKYGWLTPVLIFSILMLIVNLIVMLRTVRFEDAYITYRYGWNLAQGHGFTWNVGDAVPSEGYTTFTYVLLSALLFASGVEPLIGTQVANLLCLLAIGYLMWRLGRLIYKDEPKLFAWFPVAILVTIPATAFHVATGMETLFYMATLAGISFFAIIWLEKGQKDVRFIYALGGMILVSGLTRPDGIVYGILTLICLWFTARKSLLSRQNIIALILSLFLPGLVYFLWRTSHYKLLLPLSFYHKSFVGGLYNHAARNVLFTDFVGMFALAYLGIVFYRLFTRTLPKTAYFLLIPSLPLILYYSRVLAVAGLYYRFFFPYLFPLLIIAGYDLAEVMSELARKSRPVFSSIVSVCLLAILCLGPFYYETRNTFAFLINGDTYSEEADPYPRIGKALLYIDKRQVIGTGEVGKISMILRDYTVVDLVGLNDRYLARNPLSIDYLDKRKVNILLTFPYIRAPLGVYSDVYRKVGEAFEDIELKFLCVGNIQGLDIFVRKEPATLLSDFIGRLRNSKYFDEGICLSTTAARWVPEEIKLSLDNWTFTDLELDNNSAPLEFTITGNDPILRSSTLNLNSENIDNIIVNLEIPPKVDCSTMVLYFTRPEAQWESEERSIYIPFTPEDKIQAIKFSVREHPEWRGYIDHIRIDPVCGMNKDGTPIKLKLLDITLN